MRFLLSILLVVLATGLFTQGLYLNDEARAFREQQEGPLAAVVLDPPLVSVTAPIVRDRWPYTREAIEARRTLAVQWEARRPQEPSPPFEDLITERMQGAFGTESPYVTPYGAAVVALGALLLIVFLPRQRFRSLALLAFLIGGVAMFPAFLDPAAIGKMVEQASFVQHVIGYFPWIAVGLLFLAGLLMGGQRPRDFHFDD